MRSQILVAVLTSVVVTGSASGQLGTLWLQGTDGAGTIEVGVSQTAIIQLWLDIPANVTLIEVNAVLRAYDSSFGKDLAFEVQRFIDHTNPGLMQRTTRGLIVNDLPNGFIDDYQYGAYDPNRPLSGNSGTPGPATILLDEIIIDGLDNSRLPEGHTIYLNGPGAEMPVSWLVFDPFGGWNIDVGVGLLSIGTGSVADPLIINTVPEPRTVGLLTLGCLAVIRRSSRLNGGQSPITVYASRPTTGQRRLLR